MKFKILLKAEIKNTLTKIPKLIFSTIILIAVIGIIAFVEQNIFIMMSPTLM